MVMRVLEPHQFNSFKKPKTRDKRPFVRLATVLVAGGLVFGTLHYLSSRPDSPSAKPAAKHAPVTGVQAQSLNNRPFKKFTGEEFKNLYRTVAYPNVQPIHETDAPSITGNPDADKIIRQIAESRGYHLGSIPVNAIVKINEPRLDGDDLLQPLAASSWKSMKDQAHKDGYPLSIISAYRPPEYQRNLFTSRLYAKGTNPSYIAAGVSNNIIESTLDMTAPPGYSRHHTGYTIDLWCEDGSGAFLSSKCYKWISANNYQKAKENGWIPSYPEGTDMQGPEPEPWEYVWVGTDVLREN
ncbi:MAG: Peptidase and D,D-carboxypeptidase VanY/endolysins domain protein [Candidatus Saccharibacteria bacterium]|nr:Peptidase and D,D-carboxypeptidase VanY/endolysins domain protein [Candidatus Saccharibacteria bacterium]